MPSRYSYEYPGPRMYRIVWYQFSRGYYRLEYRKRGGLIPDYVGMTYVSFNDIVWC